MAEIPVCTVLEEADYEALKVKAIKDKTTVKKLIGDAVKKIIEEPKKETEKQ